MDHKFEKAEKIFFHDKILAKTILPFFPKFILPNHITVFRFLATPLLVILMLNENYLIGLAAFLIISFTDAIDGSMARIRNQVTSWGRIYDPLADKILIGSMVFVIILQFDFWTSILIIFLEIVIIFTAWLRKRRGEMIQANIWGKIKMLLQVLGVIILLLSMVFDWAALLPFASGTLYLAIAFAIVSLLSHGI